MAWSTLTMPPLTQDRQEQKAYTHVYTFLGQAALFGSPSFDDPIPLFFYIYRSC